MSKTMVSAVAILVSSLVISAAQADSIGVSFYVPGNAATGPLFDTAGGINDFAGTPFAVDPNTNARQQFWNDLPGSSGAGVGSMSNLQDSNGVSTSLDVAWSGSDVANNGGWQGATSDSRFFNGQLLAVTGPRLSVAFTDLPAEYLAAGFDIYVYADVDGAGTPLDFRLEAAGNILEGPVGIIDNQEATGANFDVLPTDYDIAYRTNDPNNDLAGNYIVFENRFETSFEITGDFSVSAVQLVRNIVPEPSSTLLLSFSLSAFFVRRRSR